MRVISGKHGSRKLFTLGGDATRPSSDKLKAALFSMIGPYFNGGQALDVFAGSGAVGLEALSRGMDTVWFIEKSRDAVNVIRKNIDLLNEVDNTKIIRGDALKVIASITESFDLIFLDPPYAYKNTLKVAQSLEKCVKIGGVLVIETAKGETCPDTIGALQLMTVKDYGAARIHIYEMH